jgi:hypothetical protein
MKSRGVPGSKRSPPGDSGGIPPGNPLDMDISAARSQIDGPEEQFKIAEGNFVTRALIFEN